MRLNHQYVLLLILLLPVTGPGIKAATTTQPFTIVIDAGHGGKDPGALGSIVREKDIILDVALRFGKLINKHHPTVKVIYTRSSDVFIPLQQRADIANKANANLFISIHADYSESKTVKGPTCYTLGPNRSKDNFEIAKRENAVILLEDDYEQRYEGFDPNSAESYIMFEFMQDTYMTKSIELASTIQDTFKEAGRATKSVRQDVFLVLRNTSMPSVLVELGFLTNKEEELYLKSDEGKDELSNCLLKAFTAFKTEYDKKNGVQVSIPARGESVSVTLDTPTAPKKAGLDSAAGQTAEQLQKNGGNAAAETKPEETTATATDLSDNGIRFSVQLLTSPTKLSTKDKKFKGHTVDFYLEKGTYKYTEGSYPDFESANAACIKLGKEFQGAFVVAFKDGKRIPTNDARKQVKTSN